MRVYIAGPITGAKPETLEWHSRLGRAFRDAGHAAYVPHEDEVISDYQVFRRDLQEMARADVMVATLTEPSTGVGIELGLFQGPVLVLHKGRLSPMVEGLLTARRWGWRRLEDPEEVVRVTEEMLELEE